MAKRTEVGLGPSPFKYAEEIDRYGSCTPPSTIVRDPFVDGLLDERNYGLDVAHLCIGVSKFPFVKTALRHSQWFIDRGGQNCTTYIYRV